MYISVSTVPQTNAIWFIGYEIRYWCQASFYLPYNHVFQIIYRASGKKYFSYYLSEEEELKFDIDDLFYYSSHRILRRQGHLYVNDYGMQVTLMSRYGIHNHSVVDRDYYFANGDATDLRYSNVILLNRYFGVFQHYTKQHQLRYQVKIHINGNYTIGTYSSEIKAAIAYNKAVDLAKAYGINKNYPENYIEDLSPKDYADIYLKIKISSKYLDYLKTI